MKNAQSVPIYLWLVMVLCLPACFNRVGYEAGPDGTSAGLGDGAAPGGDTTPDPGGDDLPAGDSSCAEPENLSAVNCAPVAGCPAPAICDGLVLLLHFDNQAAHGEDATHVHDFSGNGNHGTCTPPDCPTWAADSGGAGGSFSFDPTHTIEVPHADSLSVTGGVTLSVRFFPDSFPGANAFDWRVIAAKVQTGPLQSNYWIGHALDEFALTFHDGVGWQNQKTPLPYATDQWYHLVGIIDDANDSIALWVNGDLAFDNPLAATLVTDTGALYIGNAPEDDGVDGRVDDLAIWNRVLSPSERAALYP